jgi:hypothetical protein
LNKVVEIVYVNEFGLDGNTSTVFLVVSLHKTTYHTLRIPREKILVRGVHLLVMRLLIQHSYSYFKLFLFFASNIFIVLANESVMLDDKQKKVNCHTLIIVVAFTIVMLGSSSYSSSSVSAFPFQSAIHHHNKVFDKKQDSVSSGDRIRGSSHTKNSDNSNNEDSSNDNKKNNDQGTNDGSNTDADNNLQAVESVTRGEQQKQGDGEDIAVTVTDTPTPTPETTCEQGSNCTDQQGLGDHDRSTTTSSAATSEQDDNTPFVLSLPFP